MRGRGANIFANSRSRTILEPLAEVDEEEEDLDFLEKAAKSEDPVDYDELFKPANPPGRPVKLPVSIRPIDKKREEKTSLRSLDFTKDPIESLIPLPDSLQVKAFGGSALGWDVAGVRAVNLTHGLYTVLPKTCNPDTCPANACGQCPVVNREEWRGKNCPVDIITAFKLFASYVNELEAGPKDFTDLMLVADLVSIHLREQWIQFEFKGESMKQDQIGGIDQKRGKVYVNRVVNTYLKALEECQAARTKIYSKLMASRESKHKASSIHSGMMQPLDWLHALSKSEDEEEDT